MILSTFRSIIVINVNFERCLMKTITYEKSLELNNVLYIDVRSEGEYKDGTIRGALSIPVFNNEERAHLGHTYKNIGKRTAKEEGLEIASPKLPMFYKKVRELSKDYNHIVIFCARGGMRSRSIATVLDLMQLNVYQLEGGYKFYRQYVLKRFDEWDKNRLQFIALHGNTGCGKTELLIELKNKGLPVIDLEKLANHRGSVFGSIGLGEQPSQKTFEAELLYELEQLQYGPIFVEAENPKIGKRMLPFCVVNGIKDGTHVLIECDQEERVKRLVKDYATATDGKKVKDNSVLLNALNYIKSFMSNNTYNAIKEAMETYDLETAAALLLEHYYDPRYNQWKKKYGTFDYEVNTSQMDDCIPEFFKMIGKDKEIPC